jgi:SAM-dependent methyltransferase
MQNRAFHTGESLMTADFKDHFSTQSSQYQRYRPVYPITLFEWLASQTPQHTLAWDCATGNGQAALALANYFDKVIASDASENQIAQCRDHPSVEYRVASAEQSALADASVDLITVAQALHWFDQTAFYHEAWRVLKHHGVLAVWSYNLLSITPQIDAIVNHYYHDIVGAYWPPERQLVEQGYASLPAQPPQFAMTSQWNLDDLLGYLGTWSASVYYAKAQQHDPLSHIRDPLSQVWGQPAQHHTVHWPLQIRIGVKRLAS